MMGKEKIGVANCPTCGPIEILDVNNITIIYPLGANKIPIAEIICENCNNMFTTPCSWVDSIKFDYAGANIQGFSFARGPLLTEKEIKAFLSDFDSELKDFIKDSNVEN